MLIVLGIFLLTSSSVGSVIAQTTDTPSERDQELENPVERSIDSEGSQLEGDEESQSKEMQDVLSIETSVGTQSVLDKSVKVYINIESDIESSRTEVNWDVPRGLDAMSPTEEWFSIKEDESEVLVLEVMPEEPGIYEIVVDVTAWRYDTSYVDSEVIELTFDEDLHLSPQSSEYKRNKMLLIAGAVAVGVGLVIGVFFLIKVFKRKFKEWLEKD